MEIVTTESTITVDKRKLHPTLSIMLFIRYEWKLEMPIFSGGKMMTEDGMVVAYVQSDHAINHSSLIAAVTIDEKDKIEKSANRFHEQKLMLNVPLDPKAIQHIEKNREKNTSKDVIFKFLFGFNVFYIDYNFKSKIKSALASKVSMGEVQPDLVPILNLRCNQEAFDYSITQSEWIQTFSEPLGLGKFLLLELRIPEVNNINQEWKELIERACDRLEKIEELIQKGEWYEAIEKSRKIAELFFHKEGKNVNESLNKKKLKGLFIEANLTDKAFENFCNIVLNLFDFTSKFQHEKDQDGSYLLTPTPNREDAYFIYGLCVNLVNLISNKIRP